MARRESRKSETFLKKALIFGALAVIVAGAARCGGRKGDYIGEFDLSHYCLETWSGEHMCGNSRYGCGGDELDPDRSLAVPEEVLEKYPVGTRVILVYPDGREEKRVIEDTGRALGRLGRLDLPVETHEEAMERGVIENVKLYEMK